MNNPYSNLSSDASERAKALFIHYFQLSNGNSLDDDCTIEIANAVQYIIDAVVENQPEKRLDRLEKEVKSFECLQRQQIELLGKASSALLTCLEYLPQEMIDKIDPLADEISGYLGE